MAVHAPSFNTSFLELEVQARKILAAEEQLFAERRPKAKLAQQKSSNGFFDQVPLHWMLDWPTPFPMIIDRAAGVHITDTDGNSLVDLCLGDTGAMFGHGPAPIIEALKGTALRGLTTMLPSSDAQIVGRLLAERFKLPRWQIATTASDANRFAIRVARAITGRRKVLVFDGCYHGAADDTLVDLVDGQTVPRANLLGQVVNLGETTIAIPFNDVDALHAALASREVACVIAEPVMTNCGMILPEPGFHEVLRQATRDTGTLLHIDETHTISTGLGGYTAMHGLDPDIFVVGKPIGGGIPVSVWGMTDAVADKLDVVRRSQSGHGHSGIGTTLSGSALQLACLRACLEEVMTPEAYGAMNAGADRIENGFSRAIEAANLPWHVSRVGARLEVIFSPNAIRNAAEARAAASPVIEAALHLSMLNLGYLLAPFHNMVLAGPTLSTEEADGMVDAYAKLLLRLAQKKAMA